MITSSAISIVGAEYEGILTTTTSHLVIAGTTVDCVITRTTSDRVITGTAHHQHLGHSPAIRDGTQHVIAITTVQLVITSALGGTTAGQRVITAHAFDDIVLSIAGQRPSGRNRSGSRYCVACLLRAPLVLGSSICPLSSAKTAVLSISIAGTPVSPDAGAVITKGSASAGC